MTGVRTVKRANLCPPCTPEPQCQSTRPLTISDAHARPASDYAGGVPLYLGQGSSGFSKSALELYRVVASGGMFAGEFGSEGVAAGIFKQQVRRCFVSLDI